MHLLAVTLIPCCLPFQILLCVVEIVNNEVWDTRGQSSDQGVVELACEVPTGGLISFLAYNLPLVFICTILAFKTRHLPDNFNESLFIAMCVTSTLILSNCFIIVYTLSPVKSTRIMSMAIALLCNHSVALIFLFLSRVCAVLFDQSNTGDRNYFIRISKGRIFGGSFVVPNSLRYNKAAFTKLVQVRTNSIFHSPQKTLVTGVSVKSSTSHLFVRPTSRVKSTSSSSQLHQTENEQLHMKSSTHARISEEI